MRRVTNVIIGKDVRQTNTAKGPTGRSLAAASLLQVRNGRQTPDQETSIRVPARASEQRAAFLGKGFHFHFHSGLFKPFFKPGKKVFQTTDDRVNNLSGFCSNFLNAQCLSHRFTIAMRSFYQPCPYRFFVYLSRVILISLSESANVNVESNIAALYAVSR
jgi:hypothetical protein